MSRSDMEEMLRWRFVQAGGKVFPFEAAAIDVLYSLVEGNPRTTCGVARLALEASALLNTYVTPEIIEEAAKRRFID